MNPSGTLDPIDVWLAIMVLFLITVVGRTVYLYAPPRWHPRGAMARALNFAPLAAMVAICVPEVFRALLQAASGQRAWSVDVLLDPRLLAALLLFVTLKTVRNEFLSLIVAGVFFAWLAAS